MEGMRVMTAFKQKRLKKEEDKWMEEEEEGKSRFSSTWRSG
jgi:hypothetical protein